MAQQPINIGTVANDGTGDTIRDAFDKANDNFTELYTDKAPLASPTLTGTPAAPTAAPGTNTTQLASTAFVSAAVAAAVAGLLELKGNTDCSANPNYPAADKGDAYYVTVAGKIGGASGKSVDVGDVYIAKADNAGGTEASVGTSWFVIEHNLAAMLPLTGGTLSGALSVPDDAYGSGWNASVEVPTKNAVYDKIEAVVAAGGGGITALTSDVTASGSGSVAATIAAGAVSLSKMANMATASLIYRKTAGSGAPEVNTLATLKSDLALARADVGLGNVDNTSDANKRPTFATPSASFSAADADNNSHKTFSGAAQTLTLPGGLTAGTAFTGRFTTAWSLAISSSGTISKNGAAPSGVTTGSIAANSVITFLYEGSNVWVVTGSGLT